MVRLLPRRAKEHVESITNNLGNRSVVRKHDIGHPREVFVKKRSKHAWIERLNQSGEAGNIREKRCNFTPLAGQIYCIPIAGKPLREIGREISREGGIGSFGRYLPASRIAQLFDVADGLGNSRLKIWKVDRLWLR